MHPGATEKLELGLQRLAKAGGDADMLGLALQSIHGALEDHFRVVLSTDDQMPEAQRRAVLDPKQVQWKDLLDLMVLYRDLGAADREEIWRINGIRAKVAHGGRYSGSRADLESYAQLVQRLGDYAPSKAAATPARSSSGQALAEREAQRAQAERARIGQPPPPAPAPAPASQPQRSTARPSAQPQARPAAQAPARPTSRRADEAPSIPRAVRASPPPAPRSRLGWLLALGAIALLGLIAVIALVRNSTTPPASLAQSPSALPTAAAPPTSAPAATAGPRGATIAAEGGLNIRADHSLSAKVLFTAGNGSRVSIAGGPIEADGHTWWQIEIGGQRGWCAGEFLQLDTAQ